MTQERRRYPRVIIRWPVTVTTSRAITFGTTENISPSGVQISSRDPLPLGEKLRIEIRPPNRHSVEAVAWSAWRGIISPSIGLSRPATGVRFIYTSDRDFEFLHSLVD